MVMIQSKSVMKVWKNSFFHISRW